ncbi:MAG: hypothetical protein IPP46_03980 [Bacteroidetes bacterium]|nr:hypothetical protein [Bacteroidota bacterium]
MNNRTSIIRHGRIDMDYAGQALSHLLEKPEINQQLRFFQTRHYILWATTTDMWSIAYA